jgi:hypothetical protein
LITAAGTTTFKAGGIIGTTVNPLNVDITGSLWVWAGGQQDEVSVILDGRVYSGMITERCEILEPTPPGLVLLNNHLMGGSNYGSGSLNGSILSRGYGYSLMNMNDMFYPMYNKAFLQPWGYKMLLPWVLSEGAKIDDDFLRDLPSVIDVSKLNLPVLKTPDYFVIRSLR